MAKTALQMIIAEAQKLRKQNPKMEWKDAVKKASAAYRKKHGVKKPVKKSTKKPAKKSSKKSTKKGKKSMKK